MPLQCCDHMLLCKTSVFLFIQDEQNLIKCFDWIPKGLELPWPCVTKQLLTY